MNQESQTTDSSGQPHIVISYVPGRFTQCISNYETDRAANGYAFHLYRNSSNLWTKFEIPQALNNIGRSQIVLDSSDNAYVILPYVRIISATKSSKWTDWAIVYDGTATGLGAFGEVTVDRSRVKSDNIVGIFYQKASSGTTPSAVQLIEFNLAG